MTFTFHIMDEVEHVNMKHLYDYSHYIHLDGSSILCAIMWRSPAHEARFAKHAKTATHFPHPVFDPTTLITETHAQAISQRADLFPECKTPEECLACARTLNVRGVISRAQAVKPDMRLSSF